jgi:hypothetical protein
MTKKNYEEWSIKIMVDPKRVTINQIFDHLKKRCSWGPNPQAYLWWCHFKKRDFIKIVQDEDLMHVFQTKKLSREVLFVVTISHLVGDDDTGEEMNSKF